MIAKPNHGLGTPASDEIFSGGGAQGKRCPRQSAWRGDADDVGNCGWVPAIGSVHGRAYRAQKAKIKLTCRVWIGLRVVRRRRRQNRRRAQDLGFGPVVWAVVYVFDLRFLGPATSSSMPDAIICAVATTERSRRRGSGTISKRQNANRQNDRSIVRHLNPTL
jgi:hypothetical protein